MEINETEKVSLTFFDILLIWVGISSLIIIISLSMDMFSPPAILTVSLILLSLLLITSRLKLIREIRFNRIFFFLLLIAFLLRFSHSTYYMGHQDQGSYVNMSATMSRTGGVAFIDRLRESLPDYLKEKYDSYNEPGVGQVDNAETSSYSVKFYPMHPAWMAISTYIFGEGRHIYSLLFFSLVGLAGMYLLTMELTGNNKWAGYITLLFGVLNPGLVFFSTFPVGELLALCFSINGFYLLIRGINCKNKFLRIILLTGSALLFFAFCFTRMTLFIFFPILLLVTGFTFFNSKYFHLRLPLTIYFLAIISIFGLSWIFYYFKQPFLADQMYQIAFSPIIKKLGISIIPAALFPIVLIVLYLKISKFQAYVKNVLSWLEKKATIFLAYSLAISFIFFPELYSKGMEALSLSKPYPFMFQFSTIYTFMLLVSPCLLLLLLISPLIRIKYQRIQLLLVFFLVEIWFINLIQNPIIYPLYYFSRYLCSEVIPYALIFCGILLSNLIATTKWKLFSTVIILLTSVYFAYFSVIQIGHRQTENPEVLYQLDQIIDYDDVLLFNYPLQLDNRILSTPLKLFFNKQVFVNTSEISEERIQTINYFSDNSGSKYDDIYLLDQNPLDLSEEGYGNSLVLVGKYDYSFTSIDNDPSYKLGPLNQPETWKQLLLPYKYVEYHSPLFLYKVVKDLNYPRIPIANFLMDFTKSNDYLGVDLSGFSTKENGFRWTDGNEALISFHIKTPEEPVKNCQLIITGFFFTDPKNPVQRFGIKINGKELGWKEGSASNEFAFDIPVEVVNNADELNIEILLPDAKSPSSVGVSSDTRVLGLALQKLEISATLQQ